MDSELAQLEQDQATKFITEETVSTVLDIASKKSHEDGESRTLESDDETDCVKQSNEANDKDTLLMPPPTFPIGRPTAASLGLRESIEEHMKIRKPDEPEEEVDESGELDLTGIDDEELDLVSNFCDFLNDDGVNLIYGIFIFCGNGRADNKAMTRQVHIIPHSFCSTY